MSDLIEKRDERTRKRKRMKRKMDSIIGLSFHDKEKKIMSLSAEPQKLSDSRARLIVPQWREPICQRLRVRWRRVASDGSFEP